MIIHVSYVFFFFGKFSHIFSCLLPYGCHISISSIVAWGMGLSLLFHLIVSYNQNNSSKFHNLLVGKVCCVKKQVMLLNNWINKFFLVLFLLTINFIFFFFTFLFINNLIVVIFFLFTLDLLEKKMLLQPWVSFIPQDSLMVIDNYSFNVSPSFWDLMIVAKNYL